MGDASDRSAVDPTAMPFDLHPCQSDPLFGLIKDRWRLSPMVGGTLFLLLYLGVPALLSWCSGGLFPGPNVDLPFVEDRTLLVLYGFLVPAGAFLALRFFDQAERAFERFWSDRMVDVSFDEYDRFLRKAHLLYNSRALHIGALAAAAGVFGYLTVLNELDDVRQWSDLSMGFAGVYSILIGLLAWYGVHVVLLKIAVTAWAMRRVLRWPMRMQPLHPDECGGFRLFTEMAVTIALFAATLGAGVVLIILAGSLVYARPITSEGVLVAVLLESMTPLVFMVCLYRAHEVMKTTKMDLLRRSHIAFQPVFEAFQDQPAMANEGLSQELLRLRTVHEVIQALPVWPTNTQMIVQVVASIALPLLLLFVQIFVERAVAGGG